MQKFNDYQCLLELFLHKPRQNVIVTVKSLEPIRGSSPDLSQSCHAKKRSKNLMRVSQGTI
jgi:hypothetical protein